MRPLLLEDGHEDKIQLVEKCSVGLESLLRVRAL